MRNNFILAAQWILTFIFLLLCWIFISIPLRNFFNLDSFGNILMTVPLAFILLLFFAIVAASLFPHNKMTILKWAESMSMNLFFILMSPVLVPFLILWVITYPYRAYKKRKGYEVISQWMEKNKHKLLETEKEYVAITAQPITDDIPFTQSKFGGYPYLPKDSAFPTDKKKKPLFLLAQLNFAEMPHIENFPTKGILQFYIPDDEELDFSEEEIRVLYFPEVIADSSQSQTDFSSLKYKDLEGFMNKGNKLSFEKKKAHISYRDYHLRKIVGSKFPKIEKEDTVMFREKFGLDLTAEGHKVGGYPHFNQRDLRNTKKYRDENWVLLFQMDSDERADIDWSGGGVVSFFIKEEDLKKLDFSNILFYNDKP